MLFFTHILLFCQKLFNSFWAHVKYLRIVSCCIDTRVPSVQCWVADRRSGWEDEILKTGVTVPYHWERACNGGSEVTPQWSRGAKHLSSQGVEGYPWSEGQEHNPAVKLDIFNKLMWIFERRLNTFLYNFSRNKNKIHLSLAKPS